ncbi:MAG: BMP family ABC transporter substrate-binding protein [Lachnospiraceae bacterium]|nr:BMP family ABC transporter substrate-binding protein [Lachnospiraceae bacterium]
MKKVFIVVCIFVIAIIAGIFVINIYEADTEVTRDTTKVGMILNGTMDDRSWSQSHYEGMEKTAAELNLSVLYEENVTPEQVPEIIDKFAEEGCKVIVANSFEFGDSMIRAASEYPEIYFLHATGVGEDKNLSTYFGRMYQIRYLSGIVAGLQTESNEIGYVAAFPIPEVNRGINAFTLGVRSVNSEANVYVSWTNSWVDDVATAEATNKLLDGHNIDVLAMHTDSLQALEIAEERGVMSIGYNVDNSADYADTYLTAAVWDWDAFYTPTILKCLQGKFEGNHYWEGIETGVISLAPFTNKVKAGTAEVVTQEMQRISSGTYDVFYGPVYDNEGNLRVKEGESMTDNAMLNEFNWYVEGVIQDEES